MDTLVKEPGLASLSECTDSYRVHEYAQTPISSNKLFTALRSSCAVASRPDLYHWLRSEIHPLLPHESFFAAWGDFSKRELSYDVISSSQRIDAQTISGFDGVESAMERLFDTVTQAGGTWLLYKDFHRLAEECGIDTRSRIYRVAMARTRMLLVYALQDKRSMHDCLYIFSIDKQPAVFDPLLLDVLMPHIDVALRRIKSLSIVCRGKSKVSGVTIDLLSVREREVLNWVSKGKSNEEIGLILGISLNTVKNHLKRIFSKMGVTARSQAVGVYVQCSAGAV
ncbi:helix-turn-helix transcriptional regulator [Microbulbifer sp. ALW1]|uniref:helix-turn-helix transcriptional regulator n=1 Tax=Microbulbifer sp. (strain ALW1) TaxID=1516059 RepID=UPI00135937CE|nr:helix-turn-helix transcriptional regulator [Microbulbifer sp. ALW1]